MSEVLSRASWWWTVLGSMLVARIVLYTVFPVGIGVSNAQDATLYLGMIPYLFVYSEYGAFVPLTLAPIFASIGSRWLVEAALDDHYRAMRTIGGIALLTVSVAVLFLPIPFAEHILRFVGPIGVFLCVIAWVVILVIEIRHRKRSAERARQRAEAAGRSSDDGFSNIIEQGVDLLQADSSPQHRH